MPRAFLLSLLAVPVIMSSPVSAEPSTGDPMHDLRTFSPTEYTEFQKFLAASNAPRGLAGALDEVSAQFLKASDALGTTMEKCSRREIGADWSRALKKKYKPDQIQTMKREIMDGVIAIQAANELKCEEPAKQIALEAEMNYSSIATDLVEPYTKFVQTRDAETQSRLRVMIDGLHRLASDRPPLRTLVDPRASLLAIGRAREIDPQLMKFLRSQKSLSKAFNLKSTLASFKDLFGDAKL